MQASFGSMEMAQRVRPDSVLMKVCELIDWDSLRNYLKGLYKRESSGAGGQEPFDVLLMFKAILLGQWHSLSDPKLEEALRVRIDFMHFCGLSLSDAVPDETTLCRFRNRLIADGRLNRLLAAVNAQLQAHGLMVKGTTAAVLDATHLERAVNAAHIEPNRLYADKGYASKANRAWLRERKIKSAIMHKAQRNTPLTE